MNLNLSELNENEKKVIACFPVEKSHRAVAIEEIIKLTWLSIVPVLATTDSLVQKGWLRQMTPGVWRLTEEAVPAPAKILEVISPEERKEMDYLCSLWERGYITPAKKARCMELQRKSLDEYRINGTTGA